MKIDDFYWGDLKAEIRDEYGERTDDEVAGEIPLYANPHGKIRDLFEGNERFNRGQMEALQRFSEQRRIASLALQDALQEAAIQGLHSDATELGATFPDLDARLNGWLHRVEEIAIIAASGTGARITVVMDRIIQTLLDDDDPPLQPDNPALQFAAELGVTDEATLMRFWEYGYRVREIGMALMRDDEASQNRLTEQRDMGRLATELGRQADAMEDGEIPRPPMLLRVER